MSRSDLKDLGEHLDKGQAGLVVVGVADTGAKIQAAMKKAEKIEEKEMKADTKAARGRRQGGRRLSNVAPRAVRVPSQARGPRVALLGSRSGA